jgi:hypothetical protein
MWDFALITIFINHKLYVGNSSSSKCGTGVLQTPSPLQTPDVLVRATSCGAPVPYGLALLSESNTIWNNPKKKR